MKLIKNQVLFHTDGAESGGAVEVDPLSQAAGGVDTSFPTLAPDRILRMEIVKASKDPTKEDATREVLTIKMKTEKEAFLSDGKTAKPGFTCFKRISVTKSEPTGDKAGRSIEDIRRDLSLLLKAVGKPEVSARQLLDDPSIVDKQVVDVKVGLAPAKGGFPESNTFSFVLPA